MILLNAASQIHTLTGHLFRNESKKMTAVLTRIFGLQNAATAEDVVQETLLQALNTWKLKGIPDNPKAWLYRVAKNKAIDIIRRNKYSSTFDFNDREKHLLTSGYTVNLAIDHFWQEDSIKDDLLRMMFACCHPEISPENQVTLILKTLCGFSTAEVAKAFLTSEDTISKRLYRTKSFFRERHIEFEIPSVTEIKNRVDVVLNAVYLLFNEGYNATHNEELVRKDLMEEAMQLCHLLAEHPHTRLPEVFALMALMCFHTARNEGRLSAEGDIILLPLQDRSKWDDRLINEGNNYMNLAAVGNDISNYHLEAAIAFEHCIAPRFEDTNWTRILQLYEWLCRLSPSPVRELNRAAAIMEAHGPEKGLEAVEQINDSRQLETFYLYNALLGELHYRLHNPVKAKMYLETAAGQTRSEAEKRLLANKIRAVR